MSGLLFQHGAYGDGDNGLRVKHAAELAYLVGVEILGRADMPGIAYLPALRALLVDPEQAIGIGAVAGSLLAQGQAVVHIVYMPHGWDWLVDALADTKADTGANTEVDTDTQAEIDTLEALYAAPTYTG